MDSDVEENDGKYTRAKVLKRAGIGAAALYSAPVIVSSAEAGVDALKGSVCVSKSFSNMLDCPCDTCFNGSIQNMCTSSCFCFVDVKGCCQCRSIGNGCANPPCNANGDCPAGFKCVLTCCDGGGTAPGRRCLPPCTGAEGAATAAELAVVHA